jgi:hypothetical protein
LLTRIPTSNVWALTKLCLPSKSQSCSRMLMSTGLLLFASGYRHGRLWMILDALTHRVHQHAASHSWGRKVERISCYPRRLLVQTVLQVLWRGLFVVIHSILRAASLHIRFHYLRTWGIILNSVDLRVRSAQDCLGCPSHRHCLGVSHTLVSSKTWVDWRRSPSWEGRHVVWIHKFTWDEFKQMTQSVVIFNKQLQYLLLLLRLQIVFCQVRLLEFLFAVINNSTDSILERLN